MTDPDGCAAWSKRLLPGSVAGAIVLRRFIHPIGTRRFGGLLEVHAFVTNQLGVQKQALHGLTLSQRQVLILLYDAPGQRMRMTELADAALLTRSACTRLVE